MTQTLIYQNMAWHNYPIKKLKEQYLKRTAVGGCCVTCKIISDKNLQNSEFYSDEFDKF